MWGIWLILGAESIHIRECSPHLRRCCSGRVEVWGPHKTFKPRRLSLLGMDSVSCCSKHVHMIFQNDMSFGAYHRVLKTLSTCQAWCKSSCLYVRRVLGIVFRIASLSDATILLYIPPKRLVLVRDCLFQLVVDGQLCSHDSFSVIMVLTYQRDILSVQTCSPDSLGVVIWAHLPAKAFSSKGTRLEGSMPLQVCTALW